MRQVAIAVIVCAGCSNPAPIAADAPGDSPADSAIDAGMLGPWGTPTLITELSSASADDDPSFTTDLLELYFDSTRGGLGQGDVFVAKRTSTSVQFGTPTLVTELDNAADDTTPRISPDGLTIVWASDRGTPLNRDLWIATRTSRQAAWGGIAKLTELSTGAGDDSPCISSDRLTIYFVSDRNGSQDIFKATRTTAAMPFEPPVAVAGLRSATVDESQLWISADELSVYFTSDAGGGSIMRASRTNRGADFDNAVEVSELSTPAQDVDPWLSPDQRVLVFASDRNGGNLELFMSTR
jgi:Tol biopolymer transport system component